MEKKVKKLEKKVNKLEKIIKKMEEYMRADIKQQHMPVGDESRSMTYAQFVDGTYARDLDGN